MLPRESLLYLAYFDDSKSYDNRFQLVGGILLKGTSFDDLEMYFAAVIEAYVPEEKQVAFEFHASDLFNTRGPFTDVTKATAIEILDNCVDMLVTVKAPIVYGALDLDKHQRSIYGSADSQSVCFRLCLESVEQWFIRNEPDEMALVITDEPKNKDTKAALQLAYRDYRKHVRRLGGDRGILKHGHDDLYFGDSAHSYGIQAADVCTYLINRHFNSREDTEFLYKKIESLIFDGRVEPEQGTLLLL